jgi:hypothetical protein
MAVLSVALAPDFKMQPAAEMNVETRTTVSILLSTFGYISANGEEYMTMAPSLFDLYNYTFSLAFGYVVATLEINMRYDESESR